MAKIKNLRSSALHLAIEPKWDPKRKGQRKSEQIARNFGAVKKRLKIEKDDIEKTYVGMCMGGLKDNLVRTKLEKDAKERINTIIADMPNMTIEKLEQIYISGAKSESGEIIYKGFVEYAKAVKKHSYKNEDPKKTQFSKERVKFEIERMIMTLIATTIAKTYLRRIKRRYVPNMPEKHITQTMRNLNFSLVDDIAHLHDLLKTKEAHNAMQEIKKDYIVEGKDDEKIGAKFNPNNLKSINHMKAEAKKLHMKKYNRQINDRYEKHKDSIETNSSHFTIYDKKNRFLEFNPKQISEEKIRALGFSKKFKDLMIHDLAWLLHRKQNVNALTSARNYFYVMSVASELKIKGNDLEQLHKQTIPFCEKELNVKKLFEKVDPILHQYLTKKTSPLMKTILSKYEPLSKEHQEVAYPLYLELEKKYAKQIGLEKDQERVLDIITSFLEEQRFKEEGIQSFFNLINNEYAQGKTGIQPINQIIKTLRTQKK